MDAKLRLAEVPNSKLSLVARKFSIERHCAFFVVTTDVSNFSRPFSGNFRLYYEIYFVLKVGN